MDFLRRARSRRRARSLPGQNEGYFQEDLNDQAQNFNRPPIIPEPRVQVQGKAMASANDSEDRVKQVANLISMFQGESDLGDAN